MSNSSQTVDGAFVVDKLIGIPSYHWDPMFARIAVQALATFRPSVVALELPDADGLIGELEWASSCWPGPVVSDSGNTLFPFVPGDSIFEAFRAARAAGIPVHLVDLPAAEPQTVSPGKHSDARLLGPELSNRRAVLFLEANDALQAAEPPEPWYVVREAYMAQKLARLLERCERVMWVGGMAHWTRIAARIKKGDFEGPDVDLTAHLSFQRMRMAPSAMYRMTGRLPWLVARYARDPIRYDEHQAIQDLCLEATKQSDRNSVVLVVSGGAENSADMADDNEPAAPVDVARTLQYARNLAMAGDLRERPDFLELLTAAAGTIGRKYAGRLYELSMTEQSSARAAKNPALEWELTDDRREQYRCGDRIIESRPLRSPPGGLMPPRIEILRRVRDELYKDLPPTDKGEKLYWKCSPDDEESYVSFVEYVLRRASLADPEEVKSVPFQSGLRDGLDVRATLRNWAEGTIYVREEQRGHLNFMNGAIDWANASEHSEFLTGEKPAGWIDPDFARLGSCSRESDSAREVLQEDPRTQRDHRGFTFITMDAPNFVPTGTPGVTKPRPKTFFSCVIKPLLAVRETDEDNLYGWLDIMFKFCAGKPFAYYSRYLPSPMVHRIAWKHKVRVVHFPLQRLPAKLLRRHTTFRFFGFTRTQWEEFDRRRTSGAATWSA